MSEHSYIYEPIISGSYFTCDCGEQIHPSEQFWIRSSTGPSNGYEPAVDVCNQCKEDEIRQGKGAEA